MRTGLVLTVPGLPPKPKDPGGRLVRWVLLAQAPGFVYRGEEFKVDGDWLDERVGEYRQLLKGDYTAPLLREHDRDGERHGDILKLQRHSIDGKDSLIAAVAFADPDAEDKIKQGRIKYLSPAFGPVEDDRGRRFAFALREASLVAAPHQKNMSPGDTHVLGGEHQEGDKVPEHYDDKSPEMMDDDKPEARLDILEAKVDKMATALAELAELKELMEKALAEMPEEVADDAEEVAAEMGEVEEDAAIVAMREELAQLREQRDRAVFEQVQPASLTWTPGLAALIFNVWRDDKDRVGAVLADATPAEAAPVVKMSEPAPSNPWAVRLSEDVAPVEAEAVALTDNDIEAKAIEMAEGDQIKAYEIYKQLKRAALARN
jgi:hypothetical protein